MRALIIGREPGIGLAMEYVREAPYEAVVIGSLEIGQLLRFREERVLAALAEGKPVYLYTPGLPQVKNRALAGALASSQRELKNWGVLFTDGGRKRLTALIRPQMRQKIVDIENGILFILANCRIRGMIMRQARPA